MICPRNTNRLSAGTVSDVLSSRENLGCSLFLSLSVAQVATYSNLEELTCALRKHFGDLGLPQLNDGDLALLDDAIAILNPSVTQVRVVEVDTFTVRKKREHRTCLTRRERMTHTLISCRVLLPSPGRYEKSGC